MRIPVNEWDALHIEINSVEDMKKQIEQWTDNFRWRNASVGYQKTGPTKMKATLTSNKYTYHITMVYKPTQVGYLGCTMSFKASGAGRDLSDGKFNFTTWYNIMQDILGCELK